VGGRSIVNHGLNWPTLLRRNGLLSWHPDVPRLVIRKGLHDLLARVHHKGPMLHDRLADGCACDESNAAVRAGLERDAGSSKRN
jgi:hypothetical protein